jgi:hypothetical protein
VEEVEPAGETIHWAGAIILAHVELGVRVRGGGLGGGLEGRGQGDHGGGLEHHVDEVSLKGVGPLVAGLPKG